MNIHVLIEPTVICVGSPIMGGLLVNDFAHTNGDRITIWYADGFSHWYRIRVTDGAPAIIVKGRFGGPQIPDGEVVKIIYEIESAVPADNDTDPPILNRIVRVTRDDGILIPTHNEGQETTT